MNFLSALHEYNGRSVECQQRKEFQFVKARRGPFCAIS